MKSHLLLKVELTIIYHWNNFRVLQGVFNIGHMRSLETQKRHEISKILNQSDQSGARYFFILLHSTERINSTPSSLICSTQLRFRYWNACSHYESWVLLRNKTELVVCSPGLTHFYFVLEFDVVDVLNVTDFGIHQRKTFIFELSFFTFP